LSRGQDAQYALDPVKGPLLLVTWTLPGFFGKEETGEFAVRSQGLKIGRIPASQVLPFAKEAAALAAQGPHSGTWTRYGGVFGAIAALGGTLAAQASAQAKENALNVKAIGVYYDIGFADKKPGFFVGLAAPEIIVQILANFPAEDIFDYKEK
jgi:hypothetical protein